jgi:capsular polysaccharide biosynthesis protein
MLVGALVGFGLSSLQPTLYEGVARVLFFDRDGGQAQAGVDPARVLQNQVNVMTSTSVLRGASRYHGGGQTVEQIRAHVTVEALPDADVITIHALDSTPAGAAKLADSVAKAYQEVVAGDARRQAATAKAAAQAEANRLKRRLDELKAAQAADPGNAALQVEVESVTNQLQNVLTEQLQQDVEAVRRANAGGTLIEQATRPTQPAQPKRLRNTAGGAMLFLLVAVGLAWTLAGRRPPPGHAPAAITTATTRPGIGGRSAAAERTLAAERPSAPPEDHEDGWDGWSTASVAGAESNTTPTAGNGSQPPPLTPELIVAFERLAKPLQEVVETLRLDGWSRAKQSLPQVEAEKAAQHFKLDVAAILLDDGRGRFKVAGEVGLPPIQRRAAIRYDLDAWRELFEGGPRLIGEKDREQFAKAGIPVGAGQMVFLVPLVHDDIGFGLLLASVHANGNGRARFEERDVESMTAYARVIGPTLWSWVLLDRLKLRLGQER